MRVAGGKGGTVRDGKLGRGGAMGKVMFDKDALFPENEKFFPERRLNTINFLKEREKTERGRF